MEMAHEYTADDIGRIEVQLHYRIMFATATDVPFSLPFSIPLPCLIRIFHFDEPP